MRRLTAAALGVAFAFPAGAGGYGEPVLSPEMLRPVARPDLECDRFLFWIVCDPANPSPKRTPEGGEKRPETPAPRSPGDNPPENPNPASPAPSEDEPDEEERTPPPDLEPKPEPSPDPEPPKDRPKDHPPVVDGGDKKPHKDKTRGKKQ